MLVLFIIFIFGIVFIEVVEDKNKDDFKVEY